MKILHTADWHLGKRLHGISRGDEQRMVMEEIIKIADREKVNVVLVAGDIFDTFSPQTEAIELFYRTLHRLSKNGARLVIAIAGNHDSAERIEAPHPLAASCGIILAGHPDTQITPFELDSGLCISKSEPGFVEAKLPGFNYPLRLILTPYANEVTFKKFLGKKKPHEKLRGLLSDQWKKLANRHCDDLGINILMAHLYFMSKDFPAPEESDDEKSILFQGGAQALYTEDLPGSIQYVALGHLHRPQEISAKMPVIYSGSPLSYSFSEADQTKQVEIIELLPGKDATHKSIRLRQGKKLTRQRFEDLDGAVSWLEDHPETFVELTIVTDNYLSAKEKQRLHGAHSGIVAIIPEMRDSEEKNQLHPVIDLNKDLESLFSDYFKHRKGHPPNKALLEVLDEIVNS